MIFENLYSSSEDNPLAFQIYGIGSRPRSIDSGVSDPVDSSSEHNSEVSSSSDRSSGSDEAPPMGILGGRQRDGCLIKIVNINPSMEDRSE